MRVLPSIELSRTRRAFTLLELLVAVALLAVLVVVLSGIANNASKIWISGEGGNQRRQSGRAIMDSMARDIRNAMVPVDRAAQDSLQFVKNPPQISEKKYPDTLFFQAPAAPEGSLGDTAAVGYFLRWITPENGPPRGVLCRFLAGPTLSDGSLNPNHLLNDQSDGWLSPELLDAVAPGDRENQYAGLFSENVIGLWVQCLDADGNDLGDYDSRLQTSPGTLPAAVRIGLAVVDERSALRITPALRDQLILLARDPTRAPDAAAFVRVIASDDTFRSLREGTQSFTTTVPLFNTR